MPREPRCASIAPLSASTITAAMFKLFPSVCAYLAAIVSKSVWISGSSVVVMRSLPPLKGWLTCQACFGKGNGPPMFWGKDSSSRSAAGKRPFSTSVDAILCCASLSVCGFRKGLLSEGACGIASSAEICDSERCSGALSQIQYVPARMPSTFDPMGTMVRYIRKISFLECRHSSVSARSISVSFARRVRGLGSSKRATCIVMVEPPETISPVESHCQEARKSASGSTPA